MEAIAFTCILSRVYPLQIFSHTEAFSSPESAILLVSTKKSRTLAGTDRTNFLIILLAVKFNEQIKDKRKRVLCTSSENQYQPEVVISWC